MLMHGGAAAPTANNTGPTQCCIKPKPTTSKKKRSKTINSSGVIGGARKGKGGQGKNSRGAKNNNSNKSKNNSKNKKRTTAITTQVDERIKRRRTIISRQQRADSRESSKTTKHTSARKHSIPTYPPTSIVIGSNISTLNATFTCSVTRKIDNTQSSDSQHGDLALISTRV
jgi:hypothetical protein